MVQLAVVWGIYYFIHSLLAWDGMKRWVARRGFPMRFYRLAYTAVAVMGLVPMGWAYAAAPAVTWGVLPLWVKGVGAVMALAGVGVAAAGFRNYSAAEFVGWAQLRGQSGDEPLRTDGVNRYVRHPLYAGTYLLIGGWMMMFPEWRAVVAGAVTAVYLYVGSELEERRLVRQYGEAYRKYQREVPRLFPWPGTLRRRKGV